MKGKHNDCLKKKKKKKKDNMELLTYAFHRHRWDPDQKEWLKIVAQHPPTPPARQLNQLVTQP
jgi:hypothetical protein